jgi:choline dehydrogenase
LSEAFIDAARELGFPSNDDFNGASLEGAGWYQQTLWEGRRQSAAAVFLAPAMARPNLTVCTRAHVQRLVVEAGARVIAVEYLSDGASHRVGVNCEAIVSAGAIESPKVMMLSGIGPSAELREWGLPVHVDLPGVGQNLHDHPGVSIVYESNKPIPPIEQLAEAALLAKIDPGSFLPQLQFGFVAAPFAPEGVSVPEQSFTFYPSLTKPQSRGWVRLSSTWSGDPPLCNPNYLQEPADVRGLVEALELSRQLAHSAGMREWAGNELLPGASVITAPMLSQYVSAAVGTWFHPVGTCRMGLDGDAVVDPQLRVHGTENLRVVDASVIPQIPTCNTNAPTLMIAWRAAEMIRKAHL